MIEPPNLAEHLPTLDLKRLIPHLAAQAWLGFPGQDPAPLPYPVALLRTIGDEFPDQNLGELQSLRAQYRADVVAAKQILAVVDQLEGSEGFYDTVKGLTLGLPLAVANHLYGFSAWLKINLSHVFEQVIETPFAAWVTGHAHLQLPEQWQRVRRQIESAPRYVYAFLGLPHAPKDIFPPQWFRERTQPSALYSTLIEWTLAPNPKTEQRVLCLLFERAKSDPEAAAVSLAIDPGNRVSDQWITNFERSPELACVVGNVLGRWASPDTWARWNLRLRVSAAKSPRWAYHWYRNIEPEVGFEAMADLWPSAPWMFQYAESQRVPPEMLNTALSELPDGPLLAHIRQRVMTRILLSTEGQS